MVRRLAALLEEWRTNASTAEELRQSVERYIGNSWIGSDEEHKAVYSLWSAFRDKCIMGRLGMTMNERLHCFSLLEAWDRATEATSRAVVRQKIDFTSSTERAAAP